METSKKIKLLDFKLSKNLWSNLFWIYKTTFHWKWMEYAEHRQYIFWDSTKDIDWKISARTWDIYVKKYEEERDLSVLFLLDVSQTMNFWSWEKTKKDLQQEVFYSLAFSALQNNDSISALIYDENVLDFIPSSKSFSNIFRILESSEKNFQSSKKNKNTAKIFHHIDKINIKKNLIFVLTDDINFDEEKILKIVWNENDVILINIFDFFENNLLEENSNISLTWWKSFLNIDLFDKEKIKNFRKLRRKKLEILEQKLKKSKIWYIQIDDKKNIYKELVWYFTKIK